jgi:hypothetical protein
MELQEIKAEQPPPKLQIEFVNAAGEAVVRCTALLPDNTQCTRTRPASVPGGMYCAKHDVPDEDDEDDEDERLIKDDDGVSDGALKVVGLHLSKKCQAWAASCVGLWICIGVIIAACVQKNKPMFIGGMLALCLPLMGVFHLCCELCCIEYGVFLMERSVVMMAHAKHAAEYEDPEYG